ncbi:hypothetical protein N7490_002483 [Penicillium lividum]|nr:hypothetical protein N7490_002483 [Penicillium lividum]
MARCLSCFCKKNDADVDMNVPSQLHRPDHGKIARHENRIAYPAKLVALEKIDSSLKAQEDASHGHDDAERQGEIAPDQELFLGPKLTIESQEYAYSTPQSNCQNHLNAQSRKGSQFDRRDLWEVAEQRLDENYKKWVKPEKSQPMEEVIEKIQRDAKENYKQLEIKAIQSREKKQGNSDAREKFKNLLGFTLKAQELIGAVLSFDATGYASTAWSIVSFGLTLLQKDIERRDSVVNASEFLAGVISYHTVVEENYHSECTQANEGLENALVEVYVAILKYAAEVEKTRTERPGRRFGHSIAALVDDPLKNLKASIESTSKVVGDWKLLVRDEDQTKMLESIMSVLKEEVIADLKEISSHVRNKEELEVLEWLSAVQYSKPQNEKQKNRSRDSGIWLLESQVYTDWKASAGSILWLHGVATLPGDLFIVFDALDECPQEPTRKERDCLLQFMEDMIREQQEKLHLLATSRVEPHIQERLQKYTCFDLEANLGEDAQTFIKAELRHGNLSRWKDVKPSILETIEKRLLKIPERRFRWADLQIKRLEDCHKDVDIENALASVPHSLEESYQHILLGIKNNDQEEALKILTWLSFSLAPLTLDAVKTVAMLPFARSVVDICTTSLVTLNADNTIRLAHFSVKEYLISEHARTEVSFFHLSAELAHRVILERLLLELHEYSNFRLNEFNSEDKSLLDYAAHFWDGHLKSSSRSTLEDLQERIDHIFLHRQCYSNWIRSRDVTTPLYLKWYRTYGSLPSPLSMASRIGLIHTAKSLLEMGDNSYMNPAREKHYLNEFPFFFAAREGYLSLLAVLLEASSKTCHLENIMEEIDDSEEGETSLKMVLDKLQELPGLECLNPDGTGQIKDIVGEYAAANKKCGPTLVRLLLFNDGSRLNFSLDSIFRGAARSPHPEEILRMVLEWLDRAVGPLNMGVSELAAATRNPELARLWFQIIIQPGFWENLHLKRLVKKLNLELMEVFLEVYEQKIVITNEILIAAASNRRDFRILGFFLKDKDHEIPIGDKLFHAAAENPDQGFPIFKTLLDSCSPDRLIGNDIILEIISCPQRNNWTLIEELFRRQQAVFVLESVLLETAWREDSKSLQLLVAIGGPNISITDDVLLKAVLEFVPGTPDPKSLIEYILGYLGPEYVVTEDLLCLAARNPGMSQSTMSILLGRTSNSDIPNRVFTNAYNNPLIFEMLLDRTQNEPPVQEILQKIARRYDGGEVVEILIHRGLIAINEQLVEFLAGNDGALEVVLTHAPMVRATQKAFENTTGFESKHALLKLQNLDFSVSEDMVKNLVSFPYGFTSFRREEYLILLLTRLENKIPITEDNLLVAANSPSYYGNIIRILLDEKRSLNLQLFWECLWQSHCRFSEEVSDILLEYTVVEISKGMLEGIPSSESPLKDEDSLDDQVVFDLERRSSFKLRDHKLYNEHDFLARLVWFFVERNFPIPQDVMGIIMEKGHFKTIVATLDHNPYIQITNEVLNAARKNPDFYDVIWLLHILPQATNPENLDFIIRWPQVPRKCHLPSCWWFILQKSAKSVVTRHGTTTQGPGYSTTGQFDQRGIDSPTHLSLCAYQTPTSFS